MTDKRRRFPNPFTPSTSADSLPSSFDSSSTAASSSTTTSAPSSHPFSAGFQAKLKLSSLSRATGSALTAAAGIKDRSGPVSDTAPRRAAQGHGHGHYRTHWSLSSGRDDLMADGDGGLRGAQVVRKPSDARRGVMKTHVGAMGAVDRPGLRHGTMTNGGAGEGGEVPCGVALPLPFRVGADMVGHLGDVHAATAALKRLSATSTASCSKPRLAQQNHDTGTLRDSQSTRSATPPSSMIGSAELPMMEECDRRISLPSPLPPLIVPIIAPPIAPVRPHRGLAKAPSLPTIVQHVGENGTPTHTHTRPLRIAPKLPDFTPASGNDSESDGGKAKAKVSPSHVAEPVPAGLTRAPSIIRKSFTSGRQVLVNEFKPLPPPKPASRPSDEFDANVKVIDVQQRPAPTAEDDVLVRLEFAFDLSPPAATLGPSDGRDKGVRNDGAITLPIDILRRAPSKLLDFVEKYLDNLTVGTKTTARNSDASEASERMSGSRPSMTDGESAQSSDVESADDADEGGEGGGEDDGAEVRGMDAYGAEDILRNEYLKSLWIPSPTSFSFPLPPSKLPTLAHPHPHPPLPSPPVQHVPYPTAPKGRARTRNQYTQHPSSSSASALAYPAPSTALLPLTSSLSMRRRATYIKLPAECTRGTMTEVRVLMLRDRAVWDVIVARVVMGRWKWARKEGEGRLPGGSGKGRKKSEERVRVEVDREDRRLMRDVKAELRWAGMEYLVPELDELERMDNEERHRGDAGEVEADSGVGRHATSHSIASDVAAALTADPASNSATPPIPLRGPTKQSDAGGYHDPSLDHASLTAGCTPITLKHTSMNHSPMQTPPVVPTVSVTPPVLDAVSADSEGNGGREASPTTPAHMTAYPLPDQNRLGPVPTAHPKPERSDIEEEAEGRSRVPGEQRANVQKHAQVQENRQPPPRPAMSALRPESRSKSLLSLAGGQTYPAKVAVQNSAQHVRDGDADEKRPKKRESVIRFKAGRGVRRGGEGYF